MALSPGEVLGGRYIVEGTLGHGGFATVYAARHAVLDSAHAVKVLHATVDDEERGRILSEGKIQARLSHPNIVRVTDVIALDDSVALVMDRVDGQTLRALLAGGRLTAAEREVLALGLLAGVEAAHDAGLVHRDLKPENVLIGADGVPRVTDFGLARAEDPRLRGAQTLAGAIMGTPGYMAPEAYIDVSAVDARADLFALGAMLYELYGGRRPFPAGVPWVEQYQRAVDSAYTPLPVLCPDLPPGVVAAIHAALSPEPGDRPESVRALRALWSAERAEKPRSSPRHNLPGVRDSFVGRDAELDRLHRLLASGARLVTLQGLGGAGKTRLAIHHGWTHLHDWPGGVWFCDLTEARDADGVLAAVAAALDVPLGLSPQAQLGHALAGRGRCLILLDNFEQVVHTAAQTVGAWLDRAPQATFVVTSRALLGLSGEHPIPLEPLDEDAAAALFEARARASRADLSREDAATVRALVQLLEGLPLAIELAASRARIMSCAAMLERMHDRFRLLRAPTGRIGRHATLRAMLDWSWDLLSPEERSGLAQLSVFVGGFSLAAAEAVLDVEGAWAADLVQALVDRSLVRLAPRLDRYTLLVSVQEYAAERLDQLGLRAATEARHIAHYARLGDAAAIDALQGPAGAQRHRSLALDLENLRLASRRAVGRGDADVAVDAALAAWAVLELRGPLQPAVDLLEPLLALPALSTPQRIRVLRAAGIASWSCGATGVGRARYDEGLRLARETGDRLQECALLGNQGNAELHHGLMTQAWTLYTEALRLARDLRDRLREGMILGALGLVCWKLGRNPESQANLDAALALCRAQGYRRLEATIITYLGMLYWSQGRLDEAVTAYDTALLLHREVGNRRTEAITLANLGNVQQEQGRGAEARATYLAALAMDREVGARAYEGIVLSNLAQLDQMEGRWAEALAHNEAAIAIHREVGNRRSESLCLGVFGLISLQRSHLEAAEASFLAALQVAESVADRTVNGVLRAGLARVYLRQEDLSRGRAALAQALTDLRDTEQRLEIGQALCTLAELEHRAGARVQAQAAAAEASAIAERARAGQPVELIRRLAEIRALLGETAP